MLKSQVLALFGTLLAWCAWGGLSCKAQEWGFELRVVAQGLTVPWSVLWGADGWLWCTERPGRISRIHPETGEQRLLLTDIPGLYAYTETGLLGMALHPRFVDSPYVAIAYTVSTGSTVELRIVRYRYDATEDTLTAPQVLLSGIRVGNIHAGCRFLNLPDGTLLLTVGEGGIPSLSQDLRSLSGKVLRIRWDGSIPADNPLPGSPIWAWGLRNSQGLALGRGGIVYCSEHGASTDDEINLLQPGRNYGWPAVEGYCDTPTEQQFCRDSNVAAPLYAWTPTVAPCGLAYYDSALSHLPQFRHSLLLATLRGNTLYQLRLSADGRRITEVIPYALGVGRLRDVLVTPQGRVFLSTSNRDGRGTPRPGDDKIVELVPKAQDIGTTGSGEPPIHVWQEMDRMHCVVRSSAHLALVDACGRLLCRWRGGSGQRWTSPRLAPGWYGLIVHAGTRTWRQVLLVR
ncbi:MAG: PQQ-dependent sugar dehydrogenase [Candidatus Kapabacteria bacterium]|nr:PQQ-dependent sugar dehydrogenase [Candidatus Kapabacteria bacterium]MDW8012100.1 PQQ-dependent sugar dehydrogenase [Bacteroidota bacterium]